jgi:hypothetical protein
MSWDRKTERFSKFLKRKKSANNSRSKKFRQLKKEELKYKDNIDDIKDTT